MTDSSELQAANDEGGNDEKSEMREEEMEEEEKEEGEEEEEEVPKTEWSDYRASIIMGLIFVGTIIIGLLLSPIFADQDMKAFENEEAVVNPLLYIVYIIVFTVIVLFIVKKGKPNLVKFFFLGAIFVTIIYVTSPVLDAAIYGAGEDWEKKLDGRDVLAYDRLVLVGNTYQFTLEADGEFNVFSGEDNIFSHSVGVPLSDSTEVQALSIRSASGKESAVIAVKTGGIHLFSLHGEGNNKRAIHIGTFSGNLSAFRFGSCEKDNASLVFAVMDGKSGSEMLNVTELALEAENDGQISITTIRSQERPLGSVDVGHHVFEKLRGANIIGMSVLAGQEGETKISLSTFGPTYIFNIWGMKIYSWEEYTDTVHSIGLPTGRDNDDLILASRDSFQVFQYRDGKYLPGGEKEMKKGIDDITVAKIGKGDDYAVYVLSDGKVHVFEAGKKIKSHGYTEEKIKNARGLSVGDVDEDGNMEISILTTDGVSTYEIAPREIHIWVWLVGGVIGLLLVLLITYYPEWYVVDMVGILVSVGAMALIGISLAILPVLVLLVALAVYDAISVYKTKHMIALADNVMEMRLPVLLVIPKDSKYSFRRQGKLRDELESGERRGAMFMGLGDIIIPGLLVVSAFTYLPAGMMWGMEKPLLVAFGTLMGGLIGFSVLMRFVLKGNPHAGLPLLNGGTVVGYLVTYLIVYGDMGFHLSFSFI